MPAYNILLKEGAAQEELEKAKKTVKDQGGRVTKEFSLIKGFTAEFPPDMVTTLQSNHEVDVEEDAKVTTQ